MDYKEWEEMEKKRKVYVVFEKMTSKRKAENYVKSIGYKDLKEFEKETGGNLVGWWVEARANYVKRIPKNAIKKRISPIAIITGGRLFKESAYGYVKGTKAYIKLWSYLQFW